MSAFREWADRHRDTALVGIVAAVIGLTWGWLPMVAFVTLAAIVAGVLESR